MRSGQLIIIHYMLALPFVIYFIDNSMLPMGKAIMKALQVPFLRRWIQN
jgi:hypothetical protein